MRARFTTRADDDDDGGETSTVARNDDLSDLMQPSASKSNSPEFKWLDGGTVGTASGRCRSFSSCVFTSSIDWNGLMGEGGGNVSAMVGAT